MKNLHRGRLLSFYFLMDCRSALSSVQNFFMHEEILSSLGHLPNEINPQNHMKMLKTHKISILKQHCRRHISHIVGFFGPLSGL
jgi:hypothetical protein